MRNPAYMEELKKKQLALIERRKRGGDVHDKMRVRNNHRMTLRNKSMKVTLPKIGK
jgi:hypothetical protein